MSAKRTIFKGVDQENAAVVAEAVERKNADIHVLNMKITSEIESVFNLAEMARKLSANVLREDLYKQRGDPKAIKLPGSTQRKLTSIMADLATTFPEQFRSIKSELLDDESTLSTLEIVSLCQLVKPELKQELTDVIADWIESKRKD